MDQGWKIVYYETSQGKSPVLDFIGGLELKARTKASNTLDLLKEFGTKLGPLLMRKNLPEQNSGN